MLRRRRSGTAAIETPTFEPTLLASGLLPEAWRRRDCARNAAHRIADPRNALEDIRFACRLIRRNPLLSVAGRADPHRRHRNQCQRLHRRQRRGAAAARGPGSRTRFLRIYPDRADARHAARRLVLPNTSRCATRAAPSASSPPSATIAVMMGDDDLDRIRRAGGFLQLLRRRWPGSPASWAGSSCRTIAARPGRCPSRVINESRLAQPLRVGPAASIGPHRAHQQPPGGPGRRGAERDLALGDEPARRRLAAVHGDYVLRARARRVPARRPAGFRSGRPAGAGIHARAGAGGAQRPGAAAGPACIPAAAPRW